METTVVSSMDGKSLNAASVSKVVDVSTNVDSDKKKQWVEESDDSHMERFEKMRKRKRALANIFSISDDDESKDDVTDTSTSSVTVPKRRRVYRLLDESDKD
ncbi:hypothetical protein LXL04_024381 [Taraxacum kok-saghyz]